MAILFPDLDTLRLVLTSGILPVALSTQEVRAGFADEGQVYLEPGSQPSGAVMKRLRQLGVQTVKTPPVPLELECCCWLQVLPLQRLSALPQPDHLTPVLFELPAASQLPGLTGEILRLGNDRQSFRFLDDGQDGRVVLRVIGPPYYSLLRALDRSKEEKGPRAYLEQSPGVWIEIGYHHPLAEQIKPEPGTLLLLRPPHDWEYLELAPFQDIYEVLEFPLKHGKVYWPASDLRQRLQVPLSLAAGGTNEPAELWVLRQHARAALDELVQSSDDLLLSRLSFAVGGTEPDPVIVVRVRPSWQPPPVVILPGVAFRAYLKLPNLFLPVGQRLQPPLRRDAVRQLLAPEAELVTWLYPHPDNSFTPESLPDSAFRPLADWVEYVLHHERVPLQAWIDSTLFDFERFVCRDGSKPKAPESPEEKVPTSESASKRGGRGKDTRSSVFSKSREKPPDPEAEPEMLQSRVLPPGELEKRQLELERRFLDLEGPLDLPERQALWPELAEVYSAQAKYADAAVCWLNALWEDHPEAAAWAKTWQRSLLPCESKTLAGYLDEILGRDNLSSGDARLLASCVISAYFSGRPHPDLLARLNAVQQKLQGCERLLPVRAVWLVGLALCKLMQGDVLALARTRDRLLERLFTGGLSVEQDLPSFLRFAGASASERLCTIRDWLLSLPERIAAWLKRVHRPSLEPAQEYTRAYANLILAFGLARLGETEQARHLLRTARATLSDISDVHTLLRDAFTHRIEQALAGKPWSGLLPEELLEYLGGLDRINKYKVDRLREQSRILEPHEKINPYRDWQGRYTDDLGKELAGLPDLLTATDLEARIHKLFHDFGSKGEQGEYHHARILTVAVELAPRLGQAFATPLLPLVLPAVEHLPTLQEKALLLEKALFTAAHFDQRLHVQALTSRFLKLLNHEGAAVTLQTLDELAEQCFRGLRKLGLRDEIHQLLHQLSDTILQGKKLADCRHSHDRWDEALRVLLHVARGWYYFSKEAQATPILEEARTLLFKNQLENRKQVRLACSYIQTLGMAPTDVALRGINELLEKLKKVNDNFTTNDCYGLSQLNVVEAVVLAVVNEEFAVGTLVRRWLDDDEYLVRRRIHQDLELALSKAKN